MNPASPSGAAALLRANGLRPRKRWGQNFLCDQNTLDRIALAAALQPGDRVLEIGPGLGALTRTLAAKAATVTAVEIDPLLIPILERTLASYENIRIVNRDFLQLDLTKLLDDMLREPIESEPAGTSSGSARAPGAVVAANIPYNITSPLIERLFEQKSRISRIVLLVQWEFAERLAAAAGTRSYGAMSVFAQYHSRVENLGRVSRRVFLPAPDVDSAIVRLTPVIPGTVAVPDESRFFRLVRASFGQRRKTLLNALTGGGLGLTRESAAALLDKAGIDAGRRGETLSLPEFALLASEADRTRASG